jgi:hypothetical protein
MLGAVSVSKRERNVTELAGLCGFDGAIAAEDLELLGRHRIVQLVLTTGSTKEAT